MVLERVEPGMPLTNVHDNEQLTAVAIGVMRGCGRRPSSPLPQRGGIEGGAWGQGGGATVAAWAADLNELRATLHKPIY